MWFLRVCRIRVEHMERQLANLTGLVQKALTQAPHPSPSPRDYLQVPSYSRSAGTLETCSFSSFSLSLSLWTFTNILWKRVSDTVCSSLVRNRSSFFLSHFCLFLPSRFFHFFLSLSRQGGKKKSRPAWREMKVLFGKCGIDWLLEQKKNCAEKSFFSLFWRIYL